MEIKILGTGCAKCRTLEAHARKAVEEMGIAATVSKVEDINEIMGYGVWRTPGLVVDEKVVSSGHLLTVRQITELLSETE
jgi:small redox-active disulfide protein 2